MLAEGDTPEEFLEHTKLELFQDQVFCFTPKGRLIALPRGATPIDFAYAVHTDIGDTCVGAKVNGRVMPLMTELQNGDEVEIVTLEGAGAAAGLGIDGGHRQGALRDPPRDARRRPQAVCRPRPPDPRARFFARAKRPVRRRAARRRRCRGWRSTTSRTCSPPSGAAKFRRPTCCGRVYPDHKDERAQARKAEERGGLVRPQARLGHEVPRARPVAAPTTSRRRRTPIPIRGLDGEMPVRFAEGGAVPGERIVGIMTPGEGITIYPIQSPALKEFDDEPERWLDVRWDVDERRRAARFPARIEVTAINEPGTLAQIAQVIADNEGNISNIKITRAAPDFSMIAHRCRGLRREAPEPT